MSAFLMGFLVGQRRENADRRPGCVSWNATPEFASGGHWLAQQDSVQVLQLRLEFEQKLVALVDRIHSAKSIDSILIELQAEILALLDAERMTLYAIDAEKKEIYSKFLTLDKVREIRVPISDVSLAGYCALHRQTLNVADSYDQAELARISTTLHHDNCLSGAVGGTSEILCAAYAPTRWPSCCRAHRDAGHIRARLAGDPRRAATRRYLNL